MSNSSVGLRRYLRDLRGGAALVVFGALVGAGAYAMFLNHPEPQRRITLASDGYRTCREAFQAGVTNIPRGRPGYRPELDADNDGFACEPYHPAGS